MSARDNAHEAVVAEMIHARLVSIVQEAEAVILRTAYSSTIAEAQDFAAAIYDADGQLAGQSRRALGGFVGTLGRGLRGILRKLPPESLEPGDTIVTNDPWLAGGHLPDILTVRPVFVGERLVAYATSIAHVSDIGGKPTADAADGFEEGLHIPPCHLYRRDRLNEDVLRFMRANSRLPHQVVGDVQALGSAKLADRAPDSGATAGAPDRRPGRGQSDLAGPIRGCHERTHPAVARWHPSGRDLLRRL